MKKILLLVTFSFVFNSSFSIIHWQAYPITAAIGTLGSQHRLECSVFDSLLGSWQYYNTPYFSSYIDTSRSSSTIIIFDTYYTPWDKDTIFGFVIYDQELHQFMPVIQYHQDPDEPGAYVISSDGAVTVNTLCCQDPFDHDFIADAFGYLYDIKKHSWIGGFLVQDEMAGAGPEKGGLIVSSTDNQSYDPRIELNYFDPVLHNLGVNNLGNICHDCSGGDPDLYYSFHDGMLWNQGADFSAYDPKLHLWKYWRNQYLNINDYLFHDGIFYTRHGNAGTRFFGIYDDSLHKWKIDSTHFAISNVLIKDRMVAYKFSNKVYYMAFSPTQRKWVKDSSTVANGLDSLYVQNGTVKWRNSLGVTKKAGYNDATGWGNYNTPLLLNYHLTDFYSATGEPLIFVRNYSIGTDSVMYDFGDGIKTDWHQSSLWHQYKVNGHYGPGGVNYPICIKGHSSSGIQSSCQTIVQPCSATFNINSNCSGSCNGNITALPQTGQAPFSFQWSNGATSSSINSLCSGSYTVTITDNSGCSVTSNAGLNPMIVTTSPNSGTCPGSCNASVYANASGGAVPYTYLWNTGSSISSISNLCPGSYSVTVTDGNSCTSSLTTVINPVSPTAVTRYIYSEPSCSTCNDGELYYVIQSGTSPFTFSWSPNIGTVDTSYITNEMDWYDIPPGIYSMTVTDGVGCSVTHTDTLVPLNATITANGSTTFCNGDSVILSVPVQANCVYQWMSNGNNIAGATSSSYTATLSGYYQASVTDTLVVGATQTTWPGTFVSAYVLPIATISPQGPVTLCAGDSLTLTVPFQSSFAYQWKKGGVNIPGATSASYIATTAGTYKVKVTNTTTGCSNLTTTAAVITVHPKPTATITANGPTTFCVGDSVLLTANSGTGYTYQWKKNNTIIAGATSQNYYSKTAGLYRCIVSLAPCSATSLPITVTVPCVPVIGTGQKTGDDNSEENNPEIFVSYNPLVQAALVDARHLKGKNYTLHVYDIIGKEVYKDEGVVITSGNENIYKKELNLFMYSKGIYAVTLQTEYDRLVKKFVKD